MRLKSNTDTRVTENSKVIDGMEAEAAKLQKNKKPYGLQSVVFTARLRLQTQ